MAQPMQNPWKILVTSDCLLVIKRLNEGQETLIEEIRFIHENRRHNTHACNLARS